MARLEQLTYYVLFPVLLVQTLVKADLTQVPIAGVGRRAAALGARDVAALSRAARPARRAGVDGPAFTSIFQGATRWQTYVALSVSGNLYGKVGLALASVAMVAIIPLVNVFSVAVLARTPHPRSGRRLAIVLNGGEKPADLGLRHRARPSM